MLRPNIMAQFQCIQTCQVFLTIHQIQDEAEFIWSMEGISHTDNERTILELKKKIHKKSKSCSGKHIYYQTPSTHFFFQSILLPCAWNTDPYVVALTDTVKWVWFHDKIHADTILLTGADELKGPVTLMQSWLFYLYLLQKTKTRHIK